MTERTDDIESPIPKAEFKKEDEVQNDIETAVPKEAEDEGDDSHFDEDTQQIDQNETDYASVAKKDLQELISIFPHLSSKRSITELDNPLRYAALRDLGLSPKEAYLATSQGETVYDNRSHLRSAVPKRIGTSEKAMTHSELESARELFGNLSDGELQRLYKKVTK